MVNKLVLWGMLVIPWFSLILMNRTSLKRYTPVAILSMLLVTVVQEIAYAFNWFVNLEKIVPWGNITNVSLVYGMFAVATYWIFYFTYGAFWVYVLVNAIVEGIWLIAIPPLFARWHILQLNVSAWVLFAASIATAFVLYGYQSWQDKIFQKGSDSGHNRFLEQLWKKLLGSKVPAR